MSRIPVAGASVTVRRLTSEEWPLLRATRLAMLLDRPSAFGSTFERELAFDEQTWRERTEPPVLVAFDGELPVGSATLWTAPDGTTPQIVAMWVAGHARGAGVADRLVEACLEQARLQGAEQVVLNVMDDNPAARAVYERAGFRMTGEPGDAPGCREMARPAGEVNSA